MTLPDEMVERAAPEEIAWSIERLNDPDLCYDEAIKIAAALRALALENERLNSEEPGAPLGRLAERDRLQADCDEWKARFAQEARLVDSAVTERDAIERKTIEECWNRINALIKQGPLDEPAHSERNGLIMATNVIRALAHSERGDEEKANAGQ